MKRLKKSGKSRVGEGRGGRTGNQDKIPVTPEMIAAGYAALVSERPDPFFDLFPQEVEGLLVAVYVAMSEARRQVRPLPPQA